MLRPMERAAASIEDPAEAAAACEEAMAAMRIAAASPGLDPEAEAELYRRMAPRV